jgi:hypothetical protein
LKVVLIQAGASENGPSLGQNAGAVIPNAPCGGQSAKVNVVRSVPVPNGGIT